MSDEIGLGRLGAAVAEGKGGGRPRWAEDAERRRRFGRWLHGQLIDRRLTQAEFARMASVSKGIVSLWCRGERGPNAYNMDAIAEALRIDTSEVMAAAGVGDEPTDTPEMRRAIGILKRVRLTETRIAAIEAMTKTWMENDQEVAGEPEATPAAASGGGRRPRPRPRHLVPRLGRGRGTG